MMDIDNMAPDELRRRLREALAEVEELKKRLSPPPAAAGSAGTWTVTVNEAWAVWRGT